MSRIVVLLGAPGSGKGTQSKILAQKYGFTHMATGDIFRAEMAEKTRLGEKAAEYVKSGRLVPDEIVTEMVAGRMDPQGKYLLDGFPRTVEQARGLSEILGRQVDLVILLDLPPQEALKRLTSRRICGKCGEVFNVLTRRPAREGVCDRCGAALVQREDDSEATAKKRLMVYDDLTQPLVAFYKAEQVFRQVDASKSPEEVTRELCAVLESAVAVR